MKKISKISGVKKLDRQTQKDIKGGGCVQQGDLCCLIPPGGGPAECFPGQCWGPLCYFSA